MKSCTIIEVYLLELIDHFAEVRRHEQGLKQAVHVARCTLVAESFVDFLVFFLL